MSISKHIKTQIILALIPLFGFLLVIFCGFFHIKKQYGYQGIIMLYFLYVLPIITGFIIVSVIYSFAIIPLELQLIYAALIIISIMVVVFIGVAFAEIFIEKIFLAKLANK